MAGKPVHFEFPAEDADRARGFWTGLFGWEFGDSAMEGFDYRMTQFDNGTAAAVYPATEGERGPVVYLVSEDIDADVARVTDLGGKAEPKSPIPGIGWFARCHDTEGNAFSLFQGDSAAA
jgi:predicted enzyme related to lactoylglutathione lyase